MKLLMTIKYRLTKAERNNLSDALVDLKAFRTTEAKSPKVKEALYDMGYMVERNGFLVYPMRACQEVEAVIDYSYFYDIAVYANENWKGFFSEKEIACMAYDYLCDFQTSERNGYASGSMGELLRALRDEDCIKAYEWYKEIHDAIYGQTL